MLTDPIADYLTRVRNALAADHEQVEIPDSKLRRQISRILKEQGYITEFEVVDATVGKAIRVTLKYTEDRSPVISGLKRVSRPGQRSYTSKDRIPKVFGGMGTTIVSTSAGVMTGHEASKKGVGGEVVAYVW